MVYLERLNSPSQYSVPRLLCFHHYYLTVKPQMGSLHPNPKLRFSLHRPVTLTPLLETFSLPSTSHALWLLHSAKLDPVCTASEHPLVRKPLPKFHDVLIIRPNKRYFTAFCSASAIGVYLYCGHNQMVESFFLPVGSDGNYSLVVVITVENVEGEKINTTLSVQVCTQLYHNL